MGNISPHYASANGQVEIVRVLLSKGANLQIKNLREMQPLHLASEGSHGVPRTVKILLNHGADTNTKDCWGNTPLHYAAADGNEHLAHLLLDFRAVPWALNFGGKTAISLAGENGHVDLARMLREISTILLT
jgi:ankyrin repeat protein